jgi:hypothetical protein
METNLPQPPLSNPLSPLEERVWQQLVHDFASEIACIHQSLDLLLEIADSLYHSHSGLPSDPTIYTPEWLEQFLGNPDSLRRFAWHSLFGEAVERLLSGRLLLMTGHQSRAFSCVRDTYECLLWADFCRSDEKAARNWVRGKKVAPPKAFRFTSPLDIDACRHNLFSRCGTHPYFAAVKLSLLPRAPFHPALARSDFAKENYILFTKTTSYYVLVALEDIFAYVTILHPTIRRDIPQVVPMHSRVTSTLDKLVMSLNKDFKKLNGRPRVQDLPEGT